MLRENLASMPQHRQFLYSSIRLRAYSRRQAPSRCSSWPSFFDRLKQELTPLPNILSSRQLQQVDTESIQQDIDNTTSPADMGCFFKLLACNELVSPRASATMKIILGHQQFADIMMLFLPEGIHAEHKTGGLPGSVLDVGLVYGARDPLILCLMATQLANNGEGAVILGKVAAITYTAGKENYV